MWQAVRKQEEEMVETDLHSDSSDGCFRHGLICRAHAMAFHFSASQVRTSANTHSGTCGRGLGNAMEVQNSLKTGVYDVSHPDGLVTFSNVGEQ